MIKNDHFKGEPAASLARWYLPKCRMLLRTVAVLYSLSLLVPALSFAFNAENYLLPPSQGVQLGGPGSGALAAEYRVPRHLGQVVEASYAPGKLTFILIQDLHCHAEIQANIRTILDRLITRHPDLRLVAIEGGSGIIPTLELAQLPDTAAKRAVAEYFVQEGKLTGADWLAIIDRPEIELFGAENQARYNQSLALIRTFVTGENQGLVMELLDQLDFLQEQQFNSQLLSFERQRKFHQKSGANQENYCQDLIREARKHKLELFPEPLRSFNQSAKLNYYNRVMQTQYLETEIRNHLFQTDAERKLYQYQEFVEIVERLLNVSASREDMLRYRELAEKVTLPEIMQELDRNLGGTTTDLEQETQTLEKALAKAFAFYRLADQRDVALFNNTLQRLKDRRERQAALITGGYHTQALTAQIRKKGYSYVTIRPAMTSAFAGGNYFELLRYPNQPTELEHLLAGQFVKPQAMAVLNFLTQAAFRMQFKDMVLFVRYTTREMRNENFVKLQGLTLERMRSRLIKIKKEGALDFMGIRFSRKGIKILGKDALARYESPPTLVNSTQMRITALWILSGGILAVTILPLLGLTAAAYPALGVLGLGLLLVGAWEVSSHSTGDLWQRVVTGRNAMFAALGLAALPLAIGFGPLFADMVNAVSTNTITYISLLNGVTFGLEQTQSLLPDILQTVYVHEPELFLEYFKKINQSVGVLAPGTVLAMGTVSTEIILETFKKLMGRTPEEFEAKKVETALEELARHTYGKLLDDNDPEPYPGFTTTVSNKQVIEVIKDHIKIGLYIFQSSDKVTHDRSVNPNTIQGLLFTSFKEQMYETRDNKKYIIIIPHFISVYPNADNPLSIDQSLKEVIPQEVFKTILPKATQEVLDGKWKMMENETDQAEKTKKFMKFVLERPLNIKLGEELKKLMAKMEKLLKNIYMGMYHEFGHAMALRLTDELFDLWGNLLDEEIDGILSDESSPADRMIGNYIFKEMVKGRNGAARAEKEDRIPDGMTKQELARYKFQIEVFCDKWALFVYERLGKKDNPFSECGLTLTDKQREFFEQYLEKILIPCGENLWVFPESIKNTRIYKITGRLAGLSIAAPGIPIFDFYSYLTQMIVPATREPDNLMLNGDPMFLPEQSFVDNATTAEGPENKNSGLKSNKSATSPKEIIFGRGKETDPFLNQSSKKSDDLISVKRASPVPIGARAVPQKGEKENFKMEGISLSPESIEYSPGEHETNLPAPAVAPQNLSEDQVASPEPAPAADPSKNFAVGLQGDFDVPPRSGQAINNIIPDGMAPLGQIGTHPSYALGFPGEGVSPVLTGAGLQSMNPLVFSLPYAPGSPVDREQSFQGGWPQHLLPSLDTARPPESSSRLGQQNSEWTDHLNQDTLNALRVPGEVQEKILAAQRVVFLLEQAAQVLKTLKPGESLTFGFDSPELKARLDAMLQTPQGAALAGHVKTELFPINEPTGQRLTPQGWSRKNGVVVLTGQMSDLMTSTVVISRQNGKDIAAINVPVEVISREAAKQAFENNPKILKELEEHSAKLLGTMHNQNEFNDCYLIQAATVSQPFANVQSEDFKNLKSSRPGFVNASEVSFPLPLQHLLAAAQPAINKGAPRGWS